MPWPIARTRRRVVVRELLDELDDDRREVFVLAELSRAAHPARDRRGAARRRPGDHRVPPSPPRGRRSSRRPGDADSATNGGSRGRVEPRDPRAARPRAQRRPARRRPSRGAPPGRGDRAGRGKRRRTSGRPRPHRHPRPHGHPRPAGRSVRSAPSGATGAALVVAAHLHGALGHGPRASASIGPRVVAAEAATSSAPVATSLARGRRGRLAAPTDVRAESAPAEAARACTSRRAPRRARGRRAAAEARLLAAAQSALDQGRGAQALAALDEHDRRFPAGVLAPESEALRVDALLRRRSRGRRARPGPAPSRPVPGRAASPFRIVRGGAVAR